jgi:hypothetical protein
VPLDEDPDVVGRDGAVVVAQVADEQVHGVRGRSVGRSALQRGESHMLWETSLAANP